MAVKIRLRRMGAKKAPFYRVVVADSRYPRDGRFIEEIGYYDPTKEPTVLKVDDEKAKSWIAKGAQPTDTVKALFGKQGRIAKAIGVVNPTSQRPIVPLSRLPKVEISRIIWLLYIIY